jgi:hypothetical protein
MGPHGPFSAMFTTTIMTGYFQDRLNPSLVTIYDINSRSGGVLPSIQDGSTGNTGSRVLSFRFKGGRPRTGARIGARIGAVPRSRPSSCSCAFSIFVFTGFIGLFRPALVLHPRMIHPLDP